MSNNSWHFESQAKTKRKVITKKAKQASESKGLSHLFQKRPKDFRIGRTVQPKQDLSRFVKWPRYVRIQRQRAVLKKRFKVPPAINQFTVTIDKNQASTLFQLLGKYRPEDKKEKKERLAKIAEAKAANKAPASTEKPKILKYGLNHVTNLIESRKARLVVISHDVDPLELVLWLPALCRKMMVPFCIVKGKARLGTLCHQKTCTAVALTSVDKQDERALQQFIASIQPMYEDAPRTWGKGQYGIKARHKIRARERELAKERAKRVGA
eukprot:1392230-Amorphochlora_amoeboformis.AAC.1